MLVPAAPGTGTATTGPVLQREVLQKPLPPACDPLLRDAELHLPLHLAAARGHLGAVRVLVQDQQVRPGCEPHAPGGGAWAAWAAWGSDGPRGYKDTSGQLQELARLIS